MTDQSINLIVSKLEHLAIKLGVSVQEIFPYFIKEQYIISMKCSLPIVFGIIIGMFYVIWGYKLWIKKSIDNDILENITIASGIITAVLAFVTLMLIVEGGLFNFLNPEYHAIQDIIKLIK